MYDVGCQMSDVGWIQQRLSLYAKCRALRGGCYSGAKVQNNFNIVKLYWIFY